MRLWTIAFVLGIVCLQQFSRLPPKIIIALIIFIIAGGIYAGKNYWRYVRLPVAFAAGFTWALLYAYVHADEQLAAGLEGEPVVVTGYIKSIPAPSNHGTSFLFALKTVNNKAAAGTLRLLVTSQRQFYAGDEWRFSTKLKKTWGTLNPGGFDYEAYAFTEGIIASGYVADKNLKSLLASHWYHDPIDRVRQFFQDRIKENLPVSATSPWITALAIGERRDISPEAWQVLRNTGTNHLMAIAGLHIGFIAVMAQFVVAWLWRRFPRACLIIPAVHAGAIAALLMAVTYSAMAGFSIPTQRACIMLAVFLFALLLRRHPCSWQAWSTALVCVVLINPLNVLSESFWLSFASVALIIYCMSGRLSPHGIWWKLGRIQWVIAIGLVPLSVWLFQQCSLISFVANSVAIPWVGFLVAPLSFFGALLLLVSVKLGALVLLLADKILAVLWIFLSWCAHLPFVVWYQQVCHQWMIIAAIFAVIFLLLPAGAPGRYFSIIFALPLLLFVQATPARGTAWLTLLDVGQGLSAVIQTTHHVLVFDAGPRLGETYDMGESVVVPFLHAIGAQRVDMLVVSHKDNDHSGGANAVIKQFPVVAIKTSVPELFAGATYCLQGAKWRWDDVEFEFLYPSSDKLHLDNDSSCVLRVSSGDKHILLSGDIEKLAEKTLVERQRDLLAADILIAPHHGSKTSGNDDFIAAVHPRVVLFPVGYRNRYHFPNKSVVRKYEKLQVAMFATATTGAIKFVLSAKNRLLPPDLYRQVHQHYWNN